MGRQWTILSLIGSFLFILMTTAWDYCPPKPGHHLAVQISSIYDNQYKAAHPPCTSLKDAYEVLSHVFNITPSVVKNILPPPLWTVGPSFPIKNLSNLYDRPPPLVFSSSAVPLFQLYRNLRI